MSSDNQRNVQNFSTQPADGTGDAEKQWEPGASDGRDGRSCLNCGSYVSDDLARVIGDNDDQLHRCPECVDSFPELQYKAQNREHPGYQPGAAIGGDEL